MNASEAKSQPPAYAVTAVVVNYNAGSALGECVASLERQGVQDLVVVDNGSDDDSLRILGLQSPRVRVIRTRRNLGYGAGVNVGARDLKSGLLLACNPDLILQPGALSAMVDRLTRDPSLGLVGPALVSGDGSLQPSGRAFPRLGRASLQATLGVLAPKNAYSRRYRHANRERAATGIVDWVTGACLLIRREAFDAVGGFDEGYFMYVEEVDLCWRLSKAGWRTGYESSARVLHIGGISTAAVPYRMIVAHHLSLWRFARLSTGGWRRVLLPLVGAGIACRGALICVRRLLVDGGRRSAGSESRL